MKTLLQKALQLKKKEGVPVSYGNDEIELALAYLSGEINLSHLTKVLERGADSYSYVCRVISYGIREGKIDIKENF